MVYLTCLESGRRPFCVNRTHVAECFALTLTCSTDITSEMQLTAQAGSPTHPALLPPQLFRLLGDMMEAFL